MAFGISACCVLLLSIIALIMLGFLLKRDSNSNSLVSDLEKNFSSKGIMDIKSSSSSQCPSGYETMFNFEFPGTDYVCLCTNDSTGQKKLESIYTTACVLVKGYTCKKTKLDKELLLKYRGKHLCAKRSTLNYEGYVRVHKSKNCPADHHVCGITHTNKMCLPKTSKCPINSIIFSKSGLSNEDIEKFSYQNIQLDDGYKLYYSNKATGSHIPTEFKMSYDPPCISPDEIKVPEDYEVDALDGTDNYVSECENKMGLESATDPRWVKEDNHSRLRLFRENNHLVNYESTRIMNISNLDAPGHYLYSRGYSDWSRSCTSDPNKSIHENISDLKSTQSGESKKGLSIAAIILFIVAIISALIWLVFIFGKSENKVPMSACCWIWLCLILLAAVICTALLFMRTNKDYPKNNKNWSQDSCGDATTSSLLNNVVKKKTSFWRYALAGLILGILALLALCCTCCCFRRPKSSYDPMRENTYSKYAELQENDQQHSFNPQGQGEYPQVYAKKQSEPEYVDNVYKYEEPVVRTEYVQAQPAPVVRTEYVQADPAPIVRTEYVQADPAPVVRTEYVQAQPTTTYIQGEPTTRYVQGEPTTRYVSGEPTTTYVQAQPTTTYLQGEPTTRYVQGEPTTRYVQGEPTTRYVQGEPTTRYVSGEPLTSNVRYMSQSGREITREEAYGSNVRQY